MPEETPFPASAAAATPGAPAASGMRKSSHSGYCGRQYLPEREHCRRRRRQRTRPAWQALAPVAREGEPDGQHRCNHEHGARARNRVCSRAHNVQDLASVDPEPTVAS